MKKASVTIASLQLITCLLLGGCASAEFDLSTNANASSSPPPSPEGHAPSGASIGIQENFEPLYMSNGLFRGVSYGSADLANPAKVVIRDKTPTSPGSFNEYDFSYTVAFDVFSIRPATRDSFYLLGADGLNNGIIEHWSIVPPGTPGAVARSSGDPPLRKVISVLMERIYTVPTICRPKAFGVDLEERFLFAVHTPPNGAPSQLVKLPLPPNPSGISVLADANIIPILDRLSELYPLTDSVLGRFWTIAGQTPAETVVLLDANNDGVIESTFFFDHLQFEAFHGGYVNIISDGVSFL